MRLSLNFHRHPLCGTPYPRVAPDIIGRRDVGQRRHLMAMVFCEDCGEKVSTDAMTCPHCGRPRKEAKPATGWLSAFTKEHGAFVTFLTLVGAVVAFFYHWHVDLDQARLSQATVP